MTGPTQTRLFRGHHDSAPRRVDALNVPRDDRRRLTKQARDILARLQQGPPPTNVELNEISLNYRARVSDIRAVGHEVECVRGEGGLNTYHYRGYNV